MSRQYATSGLHLSHQRCHEIVIAANYLIEWPDSTRSEACDGLLRCRGSLEGFPDQCCHVVKRDALARVRHHPAIRCRIVRALERFEVAPVEWLYLVRTMRRQRDQGDAVASTELNRGEHLVAVMPVHDNQLRRVDRRVRLKCSSHRTKSPESVHPLSLQHPIDCGGAPCMSASTMRFRGKISIGGTYEPTALIAQIKVTIEPRSALVNFPTCCTPFVATTSPGFWTFVTPVSSMFQILLGG